MKPLELFELSWDGMNQMSECTVLTRPPKQIDSGELGPGTPTTTSAWRWWMADLYWVGEVAIRISHYEENQHA